jgi:sulfotransferase
VILLLSGLPRSGSSLLSAILRQNPDIDAGGRSGLLPLLWDINAAFSMDAEPFLQANGKTNLRSKTLNNLVSEYHDSNKLFSVDKSAFWTHPNNRSLITDYVKPQGKTIVLMRNVRDIMVSWVKVYEDVISSFPPEEWIMQQETFIELPILSIAASIEAGFGDDFCFVDYDDLISDTEEQLEKVYEAWGLPKFKHDLSFIDGSSVEDDNFYGVSLHSVRSVIERKRYDIALTADAEDYCERLQNVMSNLYSQRKVTI